MDFGKAIEALKVGKMIKRSGWKEFVFMQVPSIIDKQIVSKMQSLPDSVKNEFEKRFNNESMQLGAIYYDNQLAIVNESNLIVGYSPSVEDCLATDWIVFE